MMYAGFFASLMAWSIAFEAAQLVAAERYIGLRQVRAGRHPLDLPPTGPRRLLAGLWLIGWSLQIMIFVLLSYSPYVRLEALGCLGILGLGLALRRSCPYSWTLVVMTLEGGLRIGLMGRALYTTLF